MSISIGTSSGTSLSTNFYLRKYYSNNQNAAKSSKRKELSSAALAFEDSRALSRAANSLNKTDFTSKYQSSDSKKTTKDEDIDDSTRASIEAFVETYNNAITSGKKSGSRETNRYIKQLNILSKKHADELEDIGISINNDGTLKINDALLKTADKTKVKSLLSPEKEYSRNLYRISRKMNRAAEDNIRALANLQGMHFDVSL